MKPELSVLVCTHNPDAARLGRVLDALRAQTLPTDRWELIIIDNASAPPVAVDLAWQAHARLVVEPKLGLTEARLRGIAEARGEVLVFIDDDNVAAADFLAQAQKISAAWPTLGAWGGNVAPEFSAPPEEWTRAYWHLLALVDVQTPRWSNSRERNHAVPPGAGQCVRASVARHYAQILRDQPLRRRLDRVGTSLSSCGDIDLALTSLDLGLGTGQFPELKLTHIIPPSRLTEEYLLRLTEGVAYSAHIYAYLHGAKPADLLVSRSRGLFQAWERFRLPAREKAFAAALERARTRAHDDLTALDAQSNSTSSASSAPA